MKRLLNILLLSLCLPCAVCAQLANNAVTLDGRANATVDVTNGLVSASITNGLASTNFVNDSTNGFVKAAVTNGLASTNFVNDSTNGFVKAAVTNGLASIDLTQSHVGTNHSGNLRFDSSVIISNDLDVVGVISNQSRMSTLDIHMRANSRIFVSDPAGSLIIQDPSIIGGDVGTPSLAFVSKLFASDFHGAFLVNYPENSHPESGGFHVILGDGTLTVFQITTNGRALFTNNQYVAIYSSLDIHGLQTNYFPVVMLDTLSVPASSSSTQAVNRGELDAATNALSKAFVELTLANITTQSFTTAAGFTTLTNFQNVQLGNGVTVTHSNIVTLRPANWHIVLAGSFSSSVNNQEVTTHLFTNDVEILNIGFKQSVGSAAANAFQSSFGSGLLLKIMVPSNTSFTAKTSVGSNGDLRFDNFTFCLEEQ